MIESIYDAEEEMQKLPPAQRSPQVERTIEAGYPDVIELSEKTPPDVIDYVRDKDSKQHDKFVCLHSLPSASASSVSICAVLCTEVDQ